jgi:hypothetical protein
LEDGPLLIKAELAHRAETHTENGFASVSAALKNGLNPVTFSATPVAAVSTDKDRLNAAKPIFLSTDITTLKTLEADPENTFLGIP